jgi:hypothetical protein
MDGEHAAIERDGSVRSGHKGSHITAPTQRIEVITARAFPSWLESGPSGTGLEM